MKYRFFLSLTIVLCFFFSCSKDNGIETDVEKQKEFTITLNFKSEVTTEDSPLGEFNANAKTRVGTNDLIGIIVKRNGNIFANGLFDDISNVNIKLLSGNKYDFIVTVIKDAKIIMNNNSNNYGSPFNDILSNSFHYGHSEINLNSNYVDLISKDSAPETPQVDRFYGVISNFEPTDNSALNIDLKRVSFGLKFMISGITDGSVYYSCKNTNNQILLENNNITSNYESSVLIRSFKNIHNCWLNFENYTENITVNVKWTRINGVVQDLGSKILPVKRNSINIIRLKLGANDMNSTLGISTDGDMSNDEVIVEL